MNLIEELTKLAFSWRIDAEGLDDNGLKESADAVRQCRDEILALVRQAKREAKGS